MYISCIHTLHIHTGSDISDAKVFMQGLSFLFEILPAFPNVKVLDLGGGFKVPYHPSEKETDLKSLSLALENAIHEHPATKDRHLQLWFEPGKYIVSEAGKLLVQVNVVKQTTSTVFIGVNSGQNHLIRPMFYDAYHHIENVSNPEGMPRLYSVVGYICETDTLGYDRKIAEVREGDVLAIKNAGAYGFTMSNNYNARFRPAEVLVYKGKAVLIRKAETLDDLVRNEIEAVLD